MSVRIKERMKNKQVGDGDAPNADKSLSARDKFQVKSFIPVMDAFGIKLKKRAIIYDNVAK
jgi:hypothetical protein